MLIGLTANTLCLRNVDQTRLIADRPKHQMPTSNLGKNKQASIPPYAVKMEPMVHYSQQDPLYLNASNLSTAKIDFDSHTSGSEIALSSNYGPPNPVYGIPYQSDYYKEPEPIIEIIIKESNESLPAPPTPPPTPITRPAKEPVQVFYVKYKKNPNSYGDKEDIIYEPPVPAITPSTETVSESETVYSTESSPLYNYVTGPPVPSTTYRTIIKPDSEVYHGTGLKVTFGKNEENWSPSLNEAQKRDSISEASDIQNKVKKNTDREFKRSFAQPSPQPTEYQRKNNFETPQINNQPQFNGFNTPKSNIDLSQQQLRKPSQQIQNYFREDNPHSNFQGQIPILNQQFIPQQNHFEGIVEQRPIEFNDNFQIQHNHQQFNNQPNFLHFNNQPNIQQFTNQQNLQQLNNQPNIQQNHQQLNNQHNHQQFNNHQNHQQRQPDFQLNPPLRNPGNFQERPIQIKSNNERPFISNKPIESRPIQNKPFENRPTQDRPFDNRLFENHFISELPFENRPFENIPVQNRPFENQHIQSKPFENRPVYDRPIENRPIQNRPIENRPIQERPFDTRQNQGIINYRPSKPPTPQNIPLNPNPSFVPNDRRPIVPPPQIPLNYNTQQQINTKHTVDLAFSPQLQQQQHQQFQQQQLQQQQFQQQYRPIETRPIINNNPTSFQQQPIKQQQFSTEVKSSQYQQQPTKQHQFISETKTSPIPQIQITPSNGFKLEPKQQLSQSDHFIENNNKYQSTQTEQNFYRPDNVPWQVSNQAQNSFKLPSQEYKEHLSASTIKNTIDTTSKSILKTTEKPVSFATPQYKERNSPTSTVASPKQIITEATKNETKTPNLKNIASLPDEVPDELREQLLSSGILSNADIQILDYDKVGDIPIENLPPEALENLYGQGSASAPVPSIALPPNKSDVQMKVVKYDPSTEEGRKIENTYINRPKSQTLDPVVLNDTGYNRFLPLNINGTNFPIPDSPLLKNKTIGSVVILSPVGYDLSDDQSRLSRNTGVKIKGVHFVVGDIVKSLVKDPNRENFETWLKKEKSTPSEEQSVVLLVTM